MNPPVPGRDEHSLRTFVVSSADPAAMADAVGAGVQPLDPADPFALAEAVAHGDTAKPVLLAGTEAQSQLVRRQATFAVAQFPDVRVAWRAVPVTTLAVAAAAAVAARSRLVPTLAVHAFDVALDGSWSGVWVRSLAGLRPSPSVRGHLRSLRPGSGWLVAQHPAPGVTPVHDVEASPAPTVFAGSVLLVGGDAPERVVAAVQASIGASSRRVVPALADARSLYGAARAVELVGVPPAVGGTAPHVRGMCPSCWLPLATPACPFCHAAATVLSARRAS